MTCLRFSVIGEMICYIKITYYVNVGKTTTKNCSKVGSMLNLAEIHLSFR